MWFLVVMLAFSAVPSLWAYEKQEQNTQVNALGIAENPDYIIETAEDLVALSTQGTTRTGKNFAGAWGTSSTSYYIKLVNDITLTADVLTPSGDDPNYYTWTPIGNGTNHFYSNFDGGGHTITFAEYIMINTEYAGLFGYVGGGFNYIINLKVVWQDYNEATSRYGAFLYGDYVGGIIGYVKNSSISNCEVQGNILGTTQYSGGAGIGGIAGYFGRGSINHCVNRAEIWYLAMMPVSVGGIVGNSDNAGTIILCSNFGHIRPYNAISIINIGGIIGRMNFATVAVCYNAGVLESEDAANYTCPYTLYMGGIVGKIEFGSVNYSKILNCFSVSDTHENAPAVCADIAYAGGIVGGLGDSDGVATVEGCFYDYKYNVSTDNSGKIIPNTTFDGEQVTGTGENSLYNLMKIKSNLTNSSFTDGSKTYTWDDEYSWNSYSYSWDVSNMYNDGLPEIKNLHRAMVNYVYVEQGANQVVEQIGDLWNVNSVNVNLYGADTFARDGFYISGWTDGTQTYELGEAVNLTGNLTLYPVWQELPMVDVIFNAETDCNVIVYALIDGKIASQGILNSSISFTLPALDGTEISFIINTPNYNDQVNYTNTSNISIQNGGRKIILISNTTTTINVEITSINENFNNSIVI